MTKTEKRKVLKAFTCREHEPENPWKFKQPWGHQSLVMLREALTDLPLGELTCDNCATAPKCSLVFDAYNTNGDCLLEK